MHCVQVGPTRKWHETGCATLRGTSEYPWSSSGRKRCRECQWVKWSIRKKSPASSLSLPLKPAARLLARRSASAADQHKHRRSRHLQGSQRVPLAAPRQKSPDNTQRRRECPPGRRAAADRTEAAAVGSRQISFSRVAGKAGENLDHFEHA